MRDQPVNWRGEGLSARWLRWLFFLVVFMCCAVFALLAADEWVDAKTHDADNLRLFSSSLARAVDAYFGERETELSNLGDFLSEAGALSSEDRTEKLIGIFKDHHPELEAVHLYFPDGRLYASTFYSDSSPVPTLTGMENCVEKKRLCVLPTVKSAFTPGDYEIPMLYPLVIDGQTAFLIRIDLSLGNQQSLWRNAPLGPGMHVHLLREDGRLQNRFPPMATSDFSKQSGLFLAIRKWGSDAGNFSGKSPSTQEKRFGAYKKLEHYPLIVAVSIPAATLGEEWLRALQIPFYATLILIALSFIGYRFLRINSERFENAKIEAEKTLQANSEQHAAILRTAMDGFLLVDAGGNIREINEAYCLMSGYPRDELLGKTLFGLKFKKSREELSAMKREIIESGATKFETEQIRRDGSRLYLEVSVNYLPLEDGLFFAFIRDISERKKHEAQLHAEKELAHVTLESIGDGVITTDAHGFVNYLNPVAENLTGWKNSEAQGRELPQIFRIIGETSREPLPNPVVKVLKSGKIIDLANHTVLVNRDGSEFAIEDTAAPIRNRENKIVGVVLVFHDVSDKRALIERITWQAGHDSLTGLPNRVLLQDRIGLAMTSAKRNGNLLAVLFMDLDGFKEINDQFGHAAGDMLLREIASRLTASLRAGDTVSRLGGDEFVLLFEVANQEEIELCLARVSDAVREPVIVDGKSLWVTPSIGFTVYPNDDSDADSLLRHADMAMYQAKQSGRNRCRIFDLKMDQIARVSLETREQVAAALRNGELRLHYQPRIDMRSGQVTGVEALIRWQHPERGLLLPVEFLPFVEDSDLIADIGMWVIGEALAQIQKWGDSGLTVSVNTAARQLQSDDFLDELERILRRHPNVSPDRIELEILETTAIEDLHLVHDILVGCKRLGVQLSLDDFGTGYSSLSYLKYLPVDTLKIDQSFVRDMLDDPDDLAIIEAVVSMAKIFGRTVIAEGMETSPHGIMLLRLGCSHAQGYGISRPMPPEMIPNWIENWRPDPAWSRWTDHEWPLADFPLLVAEYEHEEWRRNLLRAIEGAQLLPARESRFLAWTQGIGYERLGKRTEFKEALSAHAALHDMGRKIQTLVSIGENAAARILVPSLDALAEDFIAKLEILRKAALA